MTDIIERLNDIWSDDDHERGCQGRTYSCSCGFDDRTFATAKEAATEIIRLRDLLVRCERTFDLLLEPETIGGSTVLTAFANCTETRADIRSALSREEGK